jgi:ATP-dependent RNA helicase SUPV3L1/SUV3
MSLESVTRIRNVTAVLGPTNTGKTHLAIERMLGHNTGMIGLPLRLLAREVYDRVVAKAGVANVALITGEEKIKPDNARYWVCTVEAMPRDIDPDFLAIDEIQLAADPDRGHVFTDRLLNARGKMETLMLGAGTMRDAISELIPGANFISRPRLSRLTYAGEKKLTRLPPRSAVVAFSAADVYELADVLRRQRGGAAVVIGALSPRTRNAQVELFQSGDVDFLVATDAIGMGLNLNVDHVALAATRKFDGQIVRDLTPAELAQIAGRAGRHMNDGTFGVTNHIEGFTPDIIERLENHNFDSIKNLQWRARDLDFNSLDGLRESLKRLPREQRLQRVREADDVIALEALANDPDIARLATNREAIMQLWDVCQVPDYRKISTQNHAEIVATVYKALRSPAGKIPPDWFETQLNQADRTDGDIDTLSTRLAHIRTWTFVANRDWLANAAEWQARARDIEDKLSDALHICLTQRFVDRRTSALVKGLRDKDEMNAEIAEDGTIKVENHVVGRLKGFSFIPETQSEDLQGKATRSAAAHVLGKELGMRARRVISAKADAIKLNRKGDILWRGDVIATLTAGDDPLKPLITLDADEQLSIADKERIVERLNTWLSETIADRLKPLVDLAKAEDVTGLARGIAFQMVENFGVVRREQINEQMKALDQPSRAQLRKYGVRFGAFNIFLPLLLKPASAETALMLWNLKHGAAANLSPSMLEQPPKPGLTSIPADPLVPDAYYRTLGFHPCGPRAVRIDMLERLADQIRPLIAWRAPQDNPSANPPKGSTGSGAFIVTPDMMSILGCSQLELGNVLRALGFRSENRPAPAPRVQPIRLTAEAPVVIQLPDPDPEAVATATAAMEAARLEAQASLPPSEIPTIEVWRPRRRYAEAPVREPRTDANRGARPEGRNEGRNRHRGPRRDGVATPSVVPAADGTTPVAAADGATPNTPGRDGDKPWNRDRNRGNRPEGERKFGDGKPRTDNGRPPNRDGRPPQRDGDKPFRRDGDRGPRRNDRDGGGRPPQTFRAAPPAAKTKGPDPDSPFAALMALKANMEKGEKT